MALIGTGNQRRCGDDRHERQKHEDVTTTHTAHGTCLLWGTERVVQSSIPLTVIENNGQSLAYADRSGRRRFRKPSRIS
jgi:hypothetical protein